MAIGDQKFVKLTHSDTSAVRLLAHMFVYLLLRYIHEIYSCLGGRQDY